MGIMTRPDSQFIEADVERFDLGLMTDIRHARYGLHDPHLVAVAVHADDTHDRLALGNVLGPLNLRLC